MKGITRISTIFRFSGLAALMMAGNVLSSCVTVPPHLSEPTVLEIADRVAISHGYHLTKFRKIAKYNLRKDNMWAVFYTIRPDSHGMVPTGFDFTVCVGDQTKETYLIPGR
jgi:hypothetical protein